MKAGADLGFSRGGRIFKKVSKILSSFFFRPTKMIFRPLPKRYKDPEEPCFGKNFCAAGKSLK